MCAISVYAANKYLRLPPFLFPHFACSTNGRTSHPVLSGDNVNDIDDDIGGGRTTG